jgi:hypothetical protein
MAIVRPIAFLAVAALLFLTPAYFFLAALDQPAVQPITMTPGTPAAVLLSLPEG